MAIIQEAFYIPNDIATGLATGMYRRIGGVVRYAVGSKRGQIVKHLDSVDVKVVEQAQGVGAKAFQFIQHHKKGAGIVGVGVAAIGTGVLGYKKWKNREPKVLKEYRMAMKSYLAAVNEGELDIKKINTLMKALKALKKHKDYEKFSVQFTADELETLVNRIYNYTIKLAADNAIELSNEELKPNNGAIIDLQTYLNVQKKIFKVAG